MFFITRKIIRNNILSNSSRYICRKIDICDENIVRNKKLYKKDSFKNDEDKKKEIIKLYKKSEEEKPTENALYCVSGLALLSSLSMGPGMFLASMYCFLVSNEATHERKENMLKIVRLSQSLDIKSNKKSKKSKK